MPTCTLFGERRIRGTMVKTMMRGVLLTEGDRFCILDPSSDNELVKGATPHFIQMLVDKGLLSIDHAA